MFKKLILIFLLFSGGFNTHLVFSENSDSRNISDWQFDLLERQNTKIYFAKGFSEEYIKNLTNYNHSELVKELNRNDSDYDFISFEQINTAPLVKKSNLPGIKTRRFLSPFRGKDEDFTILMHFDLGEDVIQYFSQNPTELPGIYLAGIGDNWEIYMNGILVKREVHRDTNGKILSHRAWRSVKFPLSPLFLKANDNILTFHVIGDANYAGTGLYYSDVYYLGAYNNILHNTDESLLLVLCSIYIVLGLYHLMIFLLRGDRPYIFFALFSICLGIYFFARSSIVYKLIPDSNITFRIEYGTLFFVPFLMLVFFKYLNKQTISRTDKIIFYITLLAFILQSLFSLQFAEDVLKLFISAGTIVYLFFVVSYGIYFHFFKESSIQWKKEKNTLAVKHYGNFLLIKLLNNAHGNFLLALTVVLFTLIIDGLSTLVLGKAGTSSIAGFFIFALVSVNIIARRFSELYKEAINSKTALESSIKELEVQKAAALSASQSKSDFLASMSHEIRTPMNAIIGMSELMRIDNFDEQQNSYLQDIKKMSKTLLHIINNILDISKVEAGKMLLIPVHFDFPLLYNSICSISKFSAESKSLLFKCKLSPLVPEVLYADEIRLRQVITNLINNAIKYTKEGWVSLDISIVKDPLKNDDVILISVTDTGIGIKEENISRIFEAFEQVDRSKNRGIVGTGLGLAIVKNIVTQMNGKIEVKSTYKVGSTFNVYIPFIAGDRSKIETKMNVERVIVKEGTTALVVDDNSINLNVAKGFLIHHNFTVYTANGGLESIIKVKANDFDIIFMDHMMPEMDGTEAVRIIRSLDEQRFRDVPIIALSANAVEGAFELFLESGMNDFLPKPISDDELNIILNKWLPKEKIMENEIRSQLEDAASSKPVTASDNKYEIFFEKLKDVQEINTAEGLSHVGTKKNYIQIFQMFCEDLDKTISEINKYRASGDWKAYTIEVHSQKGVFASIGVDDLRSLALRLELAGKDNDIETCIKETDSFILQMSNLRDKLIDLGIMTIN